MKKNSILLLGFIFFLEATAQQQTDGKQFVLHGTVRGQQTGRIILSYPGTDYLIRRDTAEITGGRFVLRGQIAEPSSANLYGDVKSRSVDDPNFADIYLEPGVMYVMLKAGAFKNLQMRGSKTQLQVAQLTRRLQPVRLLLDSLAAEMRRIESRLDALKDIRYAQPLNKRLDAIKAKRMRLYAEEDAANLSFVKRHPASWYSPELLYTYIEKTAVDSLAFLYNRFPDSIKNSRWGRWLKRDLGKLVSSSAGSVAPDFSVKDMNGDKLSLSFFRNKDYVLLDFWASWCVPCRQDFSRIKKIRADYRDKGFEVIAVSLDMDRKAWRTAIENDSIGHWRHCLVAEDLRKSFAGYGNENDIFEKYYVQAIPVKILVNREGVIVGRWPARNGQSQLSLEETLAREFKSAVMNAAHTGK